MFANLRITLRDGTELVPTPHDYMLFPLKEGNERPRWVCADGRQYDFVDAKITKSDMCE